jgi:hypothetical protein
MRASNKRCFRKAIRVSKLFIILVSLNGTLAIGQDRLIAGVDSLFVLPDSVKPFSIENFYQLIVQNHPVAKQAGLLSEVARQEIRMAAETLILSWRLSFSLKIIRIRNTIPL